MNIKIKILLLLLFSSCHSEEEKIDWKINELYEVKNVSKVEKNDTINIKYTDDSFVYLDEYCKWKTDFFIWLNESKLRENKVYKITNHNDGEKDNTYIYNQNDIQEVKDLYEDNEMFRQITYDIFNELTISETYCLAQANFTLNQHYQNYNGNLSDILYDYTVCDDSCFASNRLNLLGKMINEVKFVHFWHNDIEIEPCHLVNWMNSLPNGLIEIDERMYCKKDIISKSKEILSYLRNNNLEQIRLAFYSNNVFNEMKFSNEIQIQFQGELEKLVIEDEEMIVVEKIKLNVNNKYIKEDILDVTRIILPMSSKVNSGKINKFLIQTYVFKEDRYKLLGFRLESDKQKKIDTTEI